VILGSGGVVTGLDVGTTSVKAVTLKHRGNVPTLVGLAIADIDREGDRAAATAAAVRAALERSGGGKNTPLVSAVSGAGISVKHVTFPEMPRQALAESIRWEARKHIPFGGSDFILDFQPLDGADGNDGGELQVLLAAVETKLLDSHIELLQQAGIEPDTVDLAPLALMNEAEEEGLLNGDAIAMIDLGVSAISMSVYRRNGLFFARSIPLVARVAGGARDGEVEEAEGDSKRDGKPADVKKDGATKGDGKQTDGRKAAKTKPGSSGRHAKARDAKADAQAGDSSPEANGWMKTVLREVRRSLTFYNNETGKQGIDKIYLTGGRALAPGVDEMLQADLGIATEVLNPLDKLSDVGVDVEHLKAEGPRFAIALGLARRS
jgi:type IV pilus assembly protein PilM